MRMLAAAGLVFGGLGLYFGLLELGIYRLYPIETYLAMTAGTALSIVEARRRRGLWRHASAALLLLLTAGIGYWTLSFSRMPQHNLPCQVGDALPLFSLPDQDGMEFSTSSRKGVTAALYIFYRGDW
jgi:hypothetical protein